MQAEVDHIRSAHNMCSLDAQGRHVDPGATDGDACENLVDGLITQIKEVKPAKAALLTLIRMEPSKRTQGWSPKQFEYGMRLL